MSKIQSIRGMNDCLPTETPLWQYVESTIVKTLSRYGYREIRFPIVESTDLFKRSIGEVTDIVEKEMYTFLDRNDESITLRPEGTAGCVRACEQHGLLYNQTQRLWYRGPMFRYEKPQKGRLRQFHQFGAEAFGLKGPDVDAELLMLTARLWRELGIDHVVTLQLNSLGTVQSRNAYKSALTDFLRLVEDKLDADSQRRLSTNPLRILDSKNVTTQAILDDAPNLLEFLDEESKQHFEQLQALLDAAGISYQINPRLVRGLDYYGLTAFEWVTDALGAQGTVCGGGRYDSLVEQLGGKPTPAVGFGMGVERLVLLVEECGSAPEYVAQSTDVYLVADDSVKPQAIQLGEAVRDKAPHLRVLFNCGGGSFKSQMKKADKSGAKFALIIGEEEAKNRLLTLKFLREDKPQQTASLNEIVNLLQ